MFWIILIGLGLCFMGYKFYSGASNSKEKFNGLGFMFFGVIILLLGIWDNDDDNDTDEPVVTYMEDKGSVSYPNFGEHFFVLHDANRLCNSRNKDTGSNHFVVTKKTRLINSADVCDRCGHRWYNHSKK